MFIDYCSMQQWKFFAWWSFEAIKTIRGRWKVSVKNFLNYFKVFSVQVSFRKSLTNLGGKFRNSNLFGNVFEFRWKFCINFHLSTANHADSRLFDFCKISHRHRHLRARWHHSTQIPANNRKQKSFYYLSRIKIEWNSIIRTQRKT